MASLIDRKRAAEQGEWPPMPERWPDPPRNPQVPGFLKALLVETELSESLLAIGMAQKNDPLRVLRFRSSYLRQLLSRFGRIRGLLRRSIGNHAFDVAAAAAIGPRAGTPAKRGEFFGAKGPEHFEEWLRDVFSAVLLEETDDEEHEPFYAVLVRGTYREAIRRAAKLARRLSVASAAEEDDLLKKEIANDILEQQVILQGIANTAATELRDIAAGAIERGFTTRQLTTGVVRGLEVSVNSSVRFAATEITRIHAEVTLREFGRRGIEEVELEFTLNVHGGAEPCIECETLAGTRYSVKEASGIIPVHAYCQCGWVPVT